MNKLIQYVLALCVLVSMPSFAKLPPSISTGGGGLNIIFAIDVSGSMVCGSDQCVGDTGMSWNSSAKGIEGNKLTISSTGVCNSVNRIGSYVSDNTSTNTNKMLVQNNTTVESLKWNLNGAGQKTSCTLTLTNSQNPGRINLRFSLTKPRYQTVGDAISKIISDKSLASQATFALGTWGSSAPSAIGGCAQGYTYTWVPLNSNKAQNYTDIQNGIKCINYLGGGTDVSKPMEAIETYVKSTEFSPFDLCGTTIVIVMSDGAWTGGTAAAASAKRLLARSNPIKTYTVAMDITPLTTTWNNFIALSTAGGTYPANSTTKAPGVLGGDPVSTQDIVNAISASIQASLFDSYSSVAPTIMQKTTGEALLLVPDFEYKATTQWIGHLKAYSLLSTGLPNSTEAWEFGAKLKSVSPDSRAIWTAGPNLTVPTSSLPNNFTTANLNAIATAMGYSPNDALPTKIINFIRGYDAFDEDADGSTTDERWKLNDIYNSKPLYVGQPEKTITTDPNSPGGKQYFYNLNPSAYTTFVSNVASRKSMIYVGSNSGVLHAIEADTGNEVWAFVPPPLMNKLPNIASILPNSSNSIYGVDGSPISQDVYIDGQWKTYLAVTFGMGARGFSILDVTDPTKPKHVSSIERDDDSQGVGFTRSWTSDGTLNTNTTVPGLDNIYQTLGYTTSAPVFSYAKSHNQAYSPVLILGLGASNNGVANVKIWLGPNPTLSSVGAGAAVIGLVPGAQEGYLVASKDVGYVTTGVSADATTSITNLLVLNSVSNSYTVGVTTNTYSLAEGASVTGTGVPVNTVVESIDSSTQVTLSNKINVSASSTLTFIKQIFNEVLTQVDILESGSTSYMKSKYGYRMLVPNNTGYIHSFDDTGVDASTIKLPYATFSSTGAYGAYGAYTTMNSGTTFKNDRVIQQPLSVSNYLANPANQLNITYGTGDMEILSMTDKTPDNLITSIQDTEKNIFEVNTARSFKTTDSSLWGISSLFLNATSTLSPACPSVSQQGWYVRMNGLSATDENSVTKSCQNAKLSSKIETYGGSVIAPIYIPPADLSSCAIGSSAVFYRDAACGYGSGSPLYLTNMIIGGVTTYKDNVYISVSSKNNVTKVDAANKYTKVGAVITGKPGFTFKPPKLKSKIRIR